MGRRPERDKAIDDGITGSDWRPVNVDLRVGSLEYLKAITDSKCLGHAVPNSKKSGSRSRNFIVEDVVIQKSTCGALHVHEKSDDLSDGRGSVVWIPLGIAHINIELPARNSVKRDPEFILPRGRRLDDRRKERRLPDGKLRGPLARVNGWKNWIGHCFSPCSFRASTGPRIVRRVHRGGRARP